MAPYETCLQCGEEVTTDSDFCPHCGVLFEKAPAVFCETHPDREATAVCIICRRLLCSECARKRHGRMLCVEHARVKVEQDWALVFESSDIVEAELTKSFLESIGQQVAVRNFTAHGYIWEGGGDSTFSRQAVNRPAKVFVPIPDYLKARDALAEWNAAKQA